MEVHQNLVLDSSLTSIGKTALSAALERIERNLLTFSKSFPDNSTRSGIYYPRIPRNYTVVGGNSGWTTGFWTGQLWLAFELTGSTRFKLAAQEHSESFRARLENRIDLDHHDLGFLYTPSTIADYRLTRSHRARDTAIGAATELMNRYLPAAGIFQAWGHLNDAEQRGRTIVDCLMNLPLLYFAARETGEARFARAAKLHARQTANFLVRSDGTTHHTYYFDVDSGAPRHGRTRQGAADDSCWARGQAWAIYGFALMFLNTGDASFLETSARVADIFIVKLPTDRIAYWDLIYGDDSNEPRDSSACAIAVCGLIELSELLGGIRGASYMQSALDIMEALIRRCSPAFGGNGLMSRGTHNRPKGLGVDESNLWGDYFYFEALLRLQRIKVDERWKPYWNQCE